MRRATFNKTNETKKQLISTHALHAESDIYARYSSDKQTEFLPTLSMRRATLKKVKGRLNTEYFYPRSPCGERPSGVYGSVQPLDFYPRSPCGERHLGVFPDTICQAFLPTLSMRRATILPQIFVLLHIFLPTLSMRRATSADKINLFGTHHFYPRSPCGERQTI